MKWLQHWLNFHCSNLIILKFKYINIYIYIYIYTHIYILPKHTLHAFTNLSKPLLLGFYAQEQQRRKRQRKQWIIDTMRKQALNIYQTWDSFMDSPDPFLSHNPVIRHRQAIVLCVTCNHENKADFRFCNYCGLPSSATTISQREHSERFGQIHK